MPPEARAENLVIHEVDDELVVYDRVCQSAHRLNPTAARVWRKCDGRHTVQDIAAQIQCDESIVRLALDRLKNAHLLEHPVSVAAGVSRRSVVRKIAAVAAAGVLLPVISSIAAPTPAMASSDHDKDGDYDYGRGGKKGSKS